MTSQKPNIRKFIQNKPKRDIPIPKVNPLAHKGSFMDSPIFSMAQGMIENMPAKYKWAIGGAVYFIATGITTTIYLIIKLITLAF